MIPIAIDALSRRLEFLSVMLLALIPAATTTASAQEATAELQQALSEAYNDGFDHGRRTCPNVSLGGAAVGVAPGGATSATGPDAIVVVPGWQKDANGQSGTALQVDKDFLRGLQLNNPTAKIIVVPGESISAPAPQ